MTIAELKKQLKENNLSNLYLFYGEEEYLKEFYISLFQKNFDDMNIIKFDENARLHEIENAINSYPVFADKKLVIIKNSKLFKAKDKKKDAILKDLSEYVCVVIVEEVASHISKSYISLGEQVDFSKQVPGVLVKWIAGILAKKSIKINEPAARLLIEKTNSNMYAIKNELDKLVFLCNDKVTEADISQNVEESKEYKLFSIIDYIIDNDKTKYNVWDSLKRDGESPIPIISTLWGQCFYIKMLKELGQKGASLMPANRRFLANKIMYKNYDMARIDNLLALAEKYNYECLSGYMDQFMAMDVILAS